MTSDTIKQKFLYNIPLLDNDYPMVLIDKVYTKTDCNREKLYFSNICNLTKEKFDSLINVIKANGSDSIIIENDFAHFDNLIIKNAVKYYLLAFAYWFKKNNINVILK